MDIQKRDKFIRLWKEEIKGTYRSVFGLMDPSARKCARKELVTLAIPATKFMKVIDQMEESFLITDTWEIIRNRIE